MGLYNSFPSFYLYAMMIYVYFDEILGELEADM